MSETVDKNKEESQISQGSHSKKKNIKFQDQIESSNNNINESQNNNSNENSINQSYKENKSNLSLSKVITENKIGGYSTNISKDSKGYIKSKPHFEIGEHITETNGKFMEINTHFSILQKNINLLKDGIYDNSKKSLILKGSVQNSQNYLRENSNKVYKSIVDQLYEVRKLFKFQIEKAKNANLNNLKMFSGVIEFNQKLKKELDQCEYLLNHCENEIGYKLTKDPCYSFLKKENNQTTFK